MRVPGTGCRPRTRRHACAGLSWVFSCAWAGLWRVLSCGWAGLSRVFLMSSRVKLVRSDSALIDTTRLSARALPQPPLHRAVTRNG